MAESARRFYRYADENGQVYLVDSLEDIPEAARSRAEVIVLAPSPETKSEVGRQSSPVASVHSVPKEGSWFAKVGPGFWASLHGPSVGLGAGLTIAALALWKALGRFRGAALRFSIGFAVVALVAGSYMAWLYRSGDLGDAFLVSPKQLVEASRARVEHVNKETQERMGAIKEATEPKP